MLRGDDKYKRPIGVLFDAGKGRRIAGQLKLKRGDLFDSNVISIADDEFFHIGEGGCLHGVSEAGRVSVLDCVRGGMLGTTNWGDFAIHHGDVSFRYTLFGKRHVAIDEKCIRGIQFTLEGAETSVFAHDKFERFGHLRNPDEAIMDAIKRTRPEYLKGEFVKGGAMVSYFTGDWDFLPRFETVLGTVHVGRLMQVDFFGRSIEDTPRIAVDFDGDPTTLEGAWEKMREIRQFFAWMMGYVPAWKDVLVFTSRLDEDGSGRDADGNLEVSGPNEWKEVPEGARECGTLIDASRHPDHFMDVMQKWLKRNGNAKRRSANVRFLGGFPGTSDRVIEDGIVSAANTFDLLPNEDKPVTKPLGRSRRKRPLRSIVEHRAEIVLDHFGRDRLKRIEDVIRLAVKCRNHYTHGPDDRSAADVDYADFAIVLFLTETLEFIYGVSELLISGWDPTRSVRDEWHPLGGYVKSYDAKSSMVLGLQ